MILVAGTLLTALCLSVVAKHEKELEKLLQELENVPDDAQVGGEVVIF